MIYVTVGTMFLDFRRLVVKMDEIAAKTGERVIIQKGLGTTLPERCEYFDFKSRDDVLELQRQARVIVCHGGVAVLDALKVRRPLIVVPRLRRFREHLNDHQLDIAEGIERRGWGRMVLDIAELEDACMNPPPPPPKDYVPGRHRLVAAVREMVDRVSARKRAASQDAPGKRQA